MTIAGESLAAHMSFPLRRGHTPRDAITGVAGGAACGDLVAISLAIDPSDPDGRIEDAGFEASGCGASIAAGSAAVAIVTGQPLLDAAKVGVREIATELGGLSPMKIHAAELAADALHRALGEAARQARLPARDGRLLVAMSGGVDSAVAAMMSAEQGAEVVGVTLELWADPSNDAQRSCCSAVAQRGARALAHTMGMPHLSLDMRAEFRAGVVDPWLADHAAGLTPNPCVRCNGNVRLDGMLELAERLGAEALATGHYARISTQPTDERRDVPPLIEVAVDERKDQSYALAALSPRSLARLRFPLGGLRKEQVREIAGRAELPVARRPDSQDLCFLAGTSQRDFLAAHGGRPRRQGEIVDEHGEALGTHPGAEGFTVGQRHGLRIGGGSPLFVLRTDVTANTVTVGPRDRLLTEEIAIGEAVLHRDGGCIDAVKIRYRGARVACSLDLPAAAGTHERLTIRLSSPIERTAGGQLAGLYSGDALVGYGTILA